MSVGRRMKELRTRLGMSQVEFANAIGVTKQTLYKYENDMITNIPSDKIEAAAKLGRVSPAYLMGWEDDEKNQQQKYYFDDETAEIAQNIFDDHYLRALFKAARGTKPKDMILAAEFLERMKETNIDG